MAITYGISIDNDYAITAINDGGDGGACQSVQVQVNTGFKEDLESADWIQGNDQVVRAYLNQVSVYVRDFQQLDAYALEQHNPAEDIHAVDYVFNLHGDWDEK